MGIYVKRIREKVPDPQRKQCRRCHWCCRQYIHLPQRQLDLYLGQKRQETQHPFLPIIGKRLRGYRITIFEKRNPSPEKLLMNERPVPANGSSMIMALTLLLKATNNFTEVFSYGLSRSLSHILSMENLSMAQENVLGIYLTV